MVVGVPSTCRYIMEVKPGATDGPEKAYCACDNALDEIPEDDLDKFADEVGQSETTHRP